MTSPLNVLYLNHLKMASTLAETLSDKYNTSCTIDTVNFFDKTTDIDSFVKESSTLNFVPCYTQSSRGFVVLPESITTFFVQHFLGVESLSQDIDDTNLKEFISFRICQYITVLYRKFDINLKTSPIVKRGSDVVINPDIESFLLFQFNLKQSLTNLGDISVLLSPTIVGPSS